MNIPLRLLATFQQELNQEPSHLLELEGRTMWVAAEITTGIACTVIASDLSARTMFDRSSAKRKKTFRKRSLPQWAYYMAGAVSILDRQGLEMSGATIVIAGDEPIGPRYNHALGMAFVAFWYQINEKSYTTQSLLDIMETVQRDYIRA